VRPDAPGHQELGQGVLHHKHCWLRQRRLVQRPGRPACRAITPEQCPQIDAGAIAVAPCLAFRVQSLLEVGTQQRRQDAEALVDRGAENTLGFIKALGHAGVVVADAGEHKG